MNPLKNKHCIGIGSEPEGEEDRSKHGKGPFWRKQGNVTYLDFIRPLHTDDSQ
jgi:hypothetical protein